MRTCLAKGAVAFFTFCAASAALEPVAGASEFKVLPLLTLSEEYNDNLFQERTPGQKEFVTRVQPSIAFTSVGAGLIWDTTLGLDYRKYARGSRKQQLDPTAAVNGKLSFLDGFLKIDMGDTYSKVSLDVTRDKVAESLVVNQTEQNAAYISPYLTWHLAEKVSLVTGYRYNDIRYWDSVGIDKREHNAYADLSDQITSRLTISTGYNYAHSIAEPTGYDRHDVYVGFKYDYSKGSNVFGKAGYSWQSFSNGVSVSNPFWDVGATQDLGYFVVTLGTRVQYTEDPLTLSNKETSYNATISRVLERGMVSLTGSYSEYDRNEFQGALRDQQKKTAVTALWHHDLRQDLALTINATGDHLSKRSLGSDYPYHFYGSAGLEYKMNPHTTLGATYSHVSYRNEFDSTAGSTEVNRAIVEVRLTP